MQSTHQKFYFLSISALLIFSFYACSPAAPKLSPEQKFTEIEKVSSENKNVFRRPKIDILFVVDDSGSMDKHQTNLKNNISLFMDEFSQLKIINYHIGVISTSIGDRGRLRGSTIFVDAKTPNGLEILKNDVMLGTSGESTEMVFDPLAEALSPVATASYNAGFYRKEAYVVPIFITDAEDQSRSYDAFTMMKFLLSLKGTKDKILSYGAIVPSNANDCVRDENTWPLEIEKFLAMNINAGKNIVSLCDKTFGKKLVEFSKSIIAAVNKPIILDRKPAQASIKVYFGTQLIPSNVKTGWFFDPKENAIKFGDELILDESQPEDASIEVQFDAAAFGE